MNAAYYDVVVLGSSLGGLVAGALLAKNGFRVLVLGQDDVGPTYRVGNVTLPRRPFDFLPAASPVVRRSFNELALHQQVRRRISTSDVPFQVCLPRTRFNGSTERESLEREIEREFPEVKRPIEDIHRAIARASEALDAMTENDLVWPPEGFFERREFQRAASQLPFASRGSEIWDPLAELAEDHPFRHVVQTPARFASSLDPGQLSGVGIARPYASWLGGGVKIDGGHAWLRRQLTERLETYSGELRPRERADRIVLRRGSVSAVRLASTGETLGCGFVVANCELARLLRIVPDRSPFEDVFERIGEPQPRWFRYTLNLVVDAAGIPAGMADDVFYVRDPDRGRAAETMLHIERHPVDENGQVLLCVETLLLRRAVEDSPSYLDTVRERVLASVGELVPFLGDHLSIVDSPHDGRDPFDVRARRSLPVEEPWSRGPDTMEAIFGFPVRGALGACAMPTRTPIDRLYLCNDQVVPGLGLEGALLAASTVARLVVRHDRRKDWMRRGLWTKSDFS